MDWRHISWRAEFLWTVILSRLCPSRFCKWDYAIFSHGEWETFQSFAVFLLVCRICGVPFISSFKQRFWVRIVLYPVSDKFALTGKLKLSWACLPYILRSTRCMHCVPFIRPVIKWDFNNCEISLTFCKYKLLCKLSTGSLEISSTMSTASIKSKTCSQTTVACRTVYKVRHKDFSWLNVFYAYNA